MLSELLLRLLGFAPRPDQGVGGGDARLYSKDAELGWRLKENTDPSQGWLVGADGLRIVPHSRDVDGDKSVLILGDSSIFG
jgi:hypothetical protein